MNIFVVNEDPVKAAQELCDAHVVKMPTECVQILSTAHEYQRYVKINVRVRKMLTLSPTAPNRAKVLSDCNVQIERLKGYPDMPFKPVSKPEYKQHPIVEWVQADPINFHWFLVHAQALFDEYTFRFGKVHGSYAPFKRARSIKYTSFAWVFKSKRQSLVSRKKAEYADAYSRMKCCLAMPDEFRGKRTGMRSAVEAYRRFYIGDKVTFARWSNGRPPPAWWPFSTWEPPHGTLEPCHLYPDATSASPSL